MSGLSDAQEIHGILVRIDEVLNGIQVKSASVISMTPEVRVAAMTFQQSTRLLFRFNHLMSHMGLGDNINAAIAKLQRMVFMVRMLQMSMNFLMLGTGYGTLMGLMGMASVGLSSVDMLRGGS